MAEREFTWQWTGGWTPLGDGEYSIPRRAHVTGKATRGEPDLEARFEVRAGVPECVEFTLRAQPNGRGVRSSDLRLFNIEGFTHNSFMRWALKGPRGRSERIADERDWWAASAEVKNAQRRQQSVTRAELEEVARIYQENLEGNPTQAVMDGMSYGSMRTAARRVQQARAADPPLLPATKPGRKQGWAPEGEDDD